MLLRSQICPFSLFFRGLLRTRRVKSTQKTYEKGPQNTCKKSAKKSQTNCILLIFLMHFPLLFGPILMFFLMFLAIFLCKLLMFFFLSFSSNFTHFWAAFLVSFYHLVARPGGLATRTAGSICYVACRFQTQFSNNLYIFLLVFLWCLFTVFSCFFDAF